MRANVIALCVVFSFLTAYSFTSFASFASSFTALARISCPVSNHPPYSNKYILTYMILSARRLLTAFFLFFLLFSLAKAQTDCTSLIANTGFDGLSFGGWQQSGMKLQTNSAFTLKEGYAYVEQWVASPNTLPDLYIRQRLTGLSNGRYRLTVAAQHTQDSQAADGGVIFADWAETKVTTAADYELTFDVLTGEVLIGFRLTDSKANWAACDNWRLTRIGTDVSYLREGLSSLVAKAQTLSSASRDAAVKANLQEAITSAKALTTSGTSTAISTAATTLKAAMQAAERSTFAIRTSSLGTVPTVTTDSRYARGATTIFGRSSVSSSASILEQGFCFSPTNEEPTIADPRTTRYVENGGRIYCLDNLEPATLYYIRAYAITTDLKVGYGKVIQAYTLPKGNVTWSYGNEGGGLIDSRISQSASSVSALWSSLTSITGAHLNVHYASGTPTADCSYGGYIRVGPTESYQATGTLLHEMGHGIGVGTHSTYTGDIRSESSRGLWYGKRATRFLQFWDNSNDVRLTGDGTHLWATNAANALSYTINGAREDNHSDASYYGNSLLMQAIVEDGLAPVGGNLQGLAYTLDVDATKSFVITSSDLSLGCMSSFLVDKGGKLQTVALSAEEALLPANGALWTIAFDVATHTYRVRNQASGRFITYSSSNANNGFIAASSASTASNLRIQLSFVDVTLGSGDRYATYDCYHLMRPTVESNPQALALSTANITTSTAFSNTNAASNQRWLILDTDELAEAASIFEPLPDYGYDLTTAYAPYLCTGSLKDWTNNGMVTNYGNGSAPYVNSRDGARIDYPFIERWVASTGSLPDSDLEQTITDLPDGYYYLTASIISTNQSNADVAITGVKFYAQDQGMEVATGNGEPKRCALRVKVTGGKLTYGLSIRSTPANWVAIDNVRLYFDGSAADYLALATPCQPVRIPLVNPTFDDNSTLGWDMTNTWILNYNNGPEHEHFNWPYAESWANATPLENRTLTQTLDLPAGVYSLQAAVEAVRQDQPELSVGGVSLRLGDQQVDCHTGDRAPEVYTVDATLSGGATTLGFYVNATEANWVAIDNLVLRYYGPQPYLRGDVNHDGVVTIADVTALVNIILAGDGLTSPSVVCYSDINADSSVTIADVTTLVNIILGKEQGNGE